MPQKYTGLSAREVIENRCKYGVNILTPPDKESLWSRFIKKFNDPLIIILLIAGVLSIGISIYEFTALGQGFRVFFEPLGIFIAIIIATGLSFIFETKADKEFELLNQVNDDEPVEVFRDGFVSQIPKKDIVVGDIVILNTGAEVPADGKLLESVSLTVDESSLTGEPVCHKTVCPDDFDPDATFPTDHVMRGTKVMEGHGIMEVNAVGDNTENGKVYEAAQIDDSVKTPLNEQLERLGKLISYASYACGSLILAGRIIMYFSNADFEWVSFIAYVLQSVMIAVTLVVVSVPEGLPMAVTLSLACSMRRMLHTNNLVRKMHACETMGATTVICTDKTGTLTQNQMQVANADFFGNIPEEIIYEGIALNTTAQLDLSYQKPRVIGNPTEGALLLWLHDKGIDYLKLRSEVSTVDELPFSTERKYMATVVRTVTGKKILYLKGAPEIVFSLCDGMPEGIAVENLEALLLGYQNQAMRTLGFAYRILEDDGDVISDGKVVTGNLTFIGIVAISDPVRADVPDSVRNVTDAGIKIKIVTGDTPATAKEIGRQIGLWDDDRDSENNIITGVEFASLSDNELKERVGSLKIIARARPMDKKRLVEALQANNEIVAVTGDGTNDAPALKAAHVGISMGDGTAVAKEASDITIIDNSFSSIGRAVMWGRSLYRNIQRFILFQMTVNVVACLIVLCGAFMGMQSPLTVTQMLWVNLIMDTFAAMALASLPPSHGVMKEKPRSRSSFIISSAMWRDILGTGGLFTALLIGLLCWLGQHEINSLFSIFSASTNLTPGILSPFELSIFFTIFVFLQFWNMFNAKAFMTHRSSFHLKGCQWFLFIAAVIFAGQILIVEIGGNFFNVVPIGIMDWVIIIAVTSLVLWMPELFRLFHTQSKPGD